MRTSVFYGQQDIRLQEREMPRPQAGQVLIRCRQSAKVQLFFPPA
ncbi:MAG TPA: hypothetical protein VEC96_15350 [Anaerolineae bacterium]|nr:hypothetical protein [Anaerolineae bacterium]